MKTETEKIETNPEACSGCHLCELSCSFAWTRKYNPAKSRIIIEEGASFEPYRISFNEKCNDCGICVGYCYFGALKSKDTQAQA